MQNIFIEYISLVLIILVMVMIANKLRLAYPIVLVVGGLLLSFVAKFSNVTIDPEFVFFIFLPPLLYEAAWQVSWKEFWKWRRVIFSFAFPIIALTATVVAFVAYGLIPGFTLALGFLLGGIVSPPDAISATTIMRYVKVPKSLLAIAEGESLLNDASSLIIFRFALAAIITGQFHFGEAPISFIVVVTMGTATGLLVGILFYAVHRWLIKNPSIEIVLTLVTPYCMYYSAEYFHYSGVLAVVVGGLFLSSKRQQMLTYKSRIQGVNVWQILSFVLNGMIFLLIGLQLPSIVSQLGSIKLSQAIWYGVVISIVLIVLRLLCTLGASVFTRIMSHFIKVADPNPGWRSPLVLGWAGMRGVVSLAAALSVPLYLSNGEDFPFRNLILFITFVVILVTLVLQGLTLPWVIRKVNPEDKFTTIPKNKLEQIIQQKMLSSSIQFLEEKYGKEGKMIEPVSNLYSSLKIELDSFNKVFDELNSAIENTEIDFKSIYLELLQHQRDILTELNRDAEYDEEVIRKYYSIIDLEEFKLRERLAEG